MYDMIVPIALAAMTLLVVYVNIEDRRRRANMTQAERDAEAEDDAEWRC
jgi:hypothetical protein